MTDKETSLEFVEAITFPEDSCLTITLEAADYRRLMKLAKTAALIEVHRMDVIPTHEKKFTVFVRHTVNDGVSEDDLHTAVSAVADAARRLSVVAKIGEGK